MNFTDHMRLHNDQKPPKLNISNFSDFFGTPGMLSISRPLRGRDNNNLRLVKTLNKLPSKLLLKNRATNELSIS